MNPRKFFVGRAIGLIVLLVIAGIAFAFYSLNNYIYEEKQATVASSYKDAEYVIDGERIKLENGYAESQVAGSASKIITRYFGNELVTDINDDSREDVIFLLTQETGGTGVFFYVVGALNTADGYVGSDAFFLGDRIAPQTTEKGNGKIIVVNYADRKPDESFQTQPSVGKSVWLILDPESLQFGTVEQDFPGEADPNRMTLDMKAWVWEQALYNNDTKLEPKNVGDFTLTFADDGRFSATTDCNAVGGSYTVEGNQITFGEMFSTRMFCEGTQEQDFMKLLENTQSFHFTGRGRLIFDLKFDSGTVIFR